jgi:hypothetical protein
MRTLCVGDTLLLELTEAERDTVSVSDTVDDVELLRDGVGHGVARVLTELVIDSEEHPEMERVIVVETVDVIVWEFLPDADVLTEDEWQTLTVFECEEVTVADSHLVTVGDIDTESELVVVVERQPEEEKVPIGVHESVEVELLLCEAEPLRKTVWVALGHTVIEGLSEIVDETVLEPIDVGDPDTLRVAVAVSEGLRVVLPVVHALIEPVRVVDEQALDDLVIVSLFVPLLETVEHAVSVGDLEKLGDVVKEAVVVTVDEIRGECDELNEEELVVHMLILIDTVAVTLAVKKVLALTDVEPEDDKVVIIVLVTVSLVVIDWAVDWDLVNETVEHGVLDNDTDMVTVEEGDMLLLTDIEPVIGEVGEFVLETVAQVDEDWDSDWVLVKEIVVHELAEFDADAVTDEVDDLFALTLTEPEVVEEIVSDLDDVVDNVFE